MISSGDGLVKSKGFNATGQIDPNLGCLYLGKSVLLDGPSVTSTRPNGDAWLLIRDSYDAGPPGLSKEKSEKTFVMFSDETTLRCSTIEHLLRRAKAKFRLLEESSESLVWTCWPSIGR